VVAEGIWRERFGADPGLIGREINLNGRMRRVVGVVEGSFDFPAKTKIWGPLALNPEDKAMRYFHRLFTQGRLRPGYTMGQAKAEFAGLLANLARQYPESNRGKAVYLEPLAEDLTWKMRPALLVLIGAVGFVLAIACANVANLILARGAVRKSELAVRASLGATRGALVGQLLTESMLLSVLGGMLGLVLAGVALTTFPHFAPQNLPRMEQVGLDWRVASYNLLAVVVTGLVFGLLPALRLSRVDLHSTLKDRTRGGSGRTQFRSLLVVVQVAAALVLMTGAGLLIRSLTELSRVDLGFVPDGVLTMRVTPLAAQYDDKPELQVQLGRNVVRKVSEVAGVKHVAITTNLPLAGSSRYAIQIEGAPLETAASAPQIDYFAVTPGYFEAMRIPLVAGRVFRETDDRNAPRVVMVNETFVRTHFGDGRALGRRFQLGLGDPPEWREIVGVVKDVKNVGVDKGVRAQVYAPYYYSASLIATQAATFSVVVRAEQGDVATLAGAVRQKILEADASQPVWQIQTMETTVNESLARERFTLFLMVVFAGTAFVLAIIGLSGVMSYTVAQRTREIGIRLAIGAGPGEVGMMILRHALLLVGAGVVGGLVGSVIVTRALENLLYETSPQDPLTLGVIVLVFLVTAVVSGLVPALRAARIDPAVTLRAD